MVSRATRGCLLAVCIIWAANAFIWHDNQLMYILRGNILRNRHASFSGYTRLPSRFLSTPFSATTMMILTIFLFGSLLLINGFLFNLVICLFRYSTGLSCGLLSISACRILVIVGVVTFSLLFFLFLFRRYMFLLNMPIWVRWGNRLFRWSSLTIIRLSVNIFVYLTHSRTVHIR